MSRTRTDPVRVGFVGGEGLPGNVRTFLTNVRDLLTDQPTAFDCDLVVRETTTAPEGYRAVDPGVDETDRALNLLWNLTTALTRYARETPVDVLFQVTKFPLHGFATTIAGRRTDTPVLARFAGDNFREYRFSDGAQKLQAFALNNVFGQVPTHLADCIVALGPYGQGEITSRNPRATVVEIPQPVDTEVFSPVSPDREWRLRRDLGFPADERVLLTIGRLTERKGMPTVIDTARTLNARGADVRWYVVGEGPLFDQLESTPNVCPVGRLPHETLVDYYRAADLLVHPSLIEGLPNVLLEAAAVGLPSVARDVGECELVASEVFSDDTSLPDVALADHSAVPLRDRFSPEQLAGRYVNAIIETAHRSG